MAGIDDPVVIQDWHTLDVICESAHTAGDRVYIAVSLIIKVLSSVSGLEPAHCCHNS